MITLRRDTQRHHDRRRKRKDWHTFYAVERADPLTDGFGALEMLDEDRVAPGARLPRHDVDAEVVTYVREGSLAYDDATGSSGVIQAGEFRRMTAGGGFRYREANASRRDWAQVFHIGLRSAVAGLEPGHEHKRFSAAERRGGLRVIASRDGRNGLLRIHEDALVHSAMLDPGQHLAHELTTGRSAWLHVVEGEVTLGDIVLHAGDGAGVSAERAVSVTAREASEILLIDLAASPSRSRARD